MLLAIIVQILLYCLVKPLLTVCSQWVSSYSSAEEESNLLLESGGAGEETSGQPEQLPAAVLTRTELVVSQLLHYLTVDLISQHLLGN